MHNKFYLLFFLSFMLLGSVVAQQKILFDATKAEMAGNADWVIDADQHNIGFSNGSAVVGRGSESNPQQFPTPAQSTVTKSTPGTYWEGGISSWGIDMVKKGFEVETLPYDGKITYKDASNPQDLSHYAVFVVDEPNNAFSATEKTAILEFVKNGGGLFMISDHNNSDRNHSGIDSPHVWNDLMQNNTVQTDPFGITFDYANFSDKTENIPNLPGNPLLHGPMGNVTRVEYYGATSMTLHPSDNASVKGVVYKSGAAFGDKDVLVAYATFGKGKVVAMGDSSPADDGTGDPGDHLYDGWIKDANGNHERLIMNGSIWLAEKLTATNSVKKKDDISITFFNSGKDGALKIGNLPAGGNARLVIYDLSGRRIADFSSVQSGHSYSFDFPSGRIFIYRLTGNDFSKTGKFYF